MSLLTTGTGTFNLYSNEGPILPWLRTIDAFDTHDDSIQLVMAGGVTSMQVLPGSINAIGTAETPAPWLCTLMDILQPAKHL